MKPTLRWHDHITLNIYWLGTNVASGSITPVILPYLAALFVPPELKNTYLANIRAVGLAVAMLVQPMAGMLSARSTSRWGRRRPFIFSGALLNVVFLLIIGASPLFLGSALDGAVQPALGVGAAYLVLLIGIVLLQISSNLGHGALQGLIPDLVPEDQRGRSSGVKAVMELLPVFLVLVIGPLVDSGRVWVAIGIVMGGFLITMLITVIFVHEEPLKEKPAGAIAGRMLRLVGLTAIFVFVPRIAVWVVGYAGRALRGGGGGARKQSPLG